MTTPWQIEEALSQVRDLQRRVIERQRFLGYSGRARALGGSVALAAAALAGSSWFPQTASAHVAVWGVVFVASLLVNYGAVIHWWLFDTRAMRDIRKLKPAFDAFPVLLVGGVLTLVMLVHEQHQFLFGIWMCLFGLANLASRYLVPRMMGCVGWFYIACGTACLLSPAIQFTSPWPMALVFCIGEWTGGLILHAERLPRASLGRLMSDLLLGGTTDGRR